MIVTKDMMEIVGSESHLTMLPIDLSMSDMKKSIEIPKGDIRVLITDEIWDGVYDLTGHIRNGLRNQMKSLTTLVPSIKIPLKAF